MDYKLNLAHAQPRVLPVSRGQVGQTKIKSDFRYARRRLFKGLEPIEGLSVRRGKKEGVESQVQPSKASKMRQVNYL